ncbi:MAG: UPF0182 family protein [Actinobacteria bacterium]|nr:UPF0182 family protein [Actinomycetota bacterium]
MRYMGKIKWLFALIVLLFITFAGKIVDLYTEWLWFKEVGFTSVFVKTLFLQIALGIGGGLIFFLFLGANILLARHFAPKYTIYSDDDVVSKLRAYFQMAAQKYRTTVNFYFNLILFTVIFLFSLGAGLDMSGRWNDVLRFLNQVSFKSVDPIFNRDIGFYVFTLPIYQYLRSWALFLLVMTTLVSVFVHLFDGAIRFRRGLSFAPYVKAHLSSLVGLIFLVIAFSYRLNMFELMYSSRGVIYGAGYSDIHAQLPALKILTFIAVGCGALLLINIYLRGFAFPIAGVSILIISSILVGDIYPSIVQQYQVSPNEIEKEKPYIKLSIKGTREAYGLTNIKEREFPANENLTIQDIAKNEATINNIRLWDWRPLNKTYNQIQGIRPYYKFNDVDVDRYYIDGKYREVTLSARELSSDQLPEGARTWINEHIVYTHGYGVALNTVSEVTPDGLPRLLIKDIPPVSSVDLKITRPEIYYGEIASDYVITKTETQEFDYPRGDANKYTTYQGKGGVPLDSFLTRVAFALKFSSLKLFLSDTITEKSRILFNRPIQNRVNTIAPFLSYDSDPYIVISKDGKLYWMMDGYSLTDMYPYSKPFGGSGYNYIRNSVKVVIDAYNGDTNFYIIDKNDPILGAYKKAFPKLFKSFDAMPSDLKNHIRYPEDLFRIQTRMYALYHMKDPQVFYNKEDLWNIPNEIYGQSQQEIEPYYVTMKLPEEKQAEFILMTPFTPSTKNNMIAWMAAKSDPDNYAQLLVYKFPKQKLIYGPMQIEARIDQDSEISKQLTLWSQKGSQVIRGNLLVIPIEQSLLYVEPLYLQAEQSELPELKRVTVIYGSKIVMEQTLEEALQKVFVGAASSTAPAKPSEEKVSVSDLIKQASDYFNKALEYQKQGDWSGYGEQIKNLEDTLKSLKEKAE